MTAARPPAKAPGRGGGLSAGERDEPEDERQFPGRFLVERLQSASSARTKAAAAAKMTVQGRAAARGRGRAGRRPGAREGWRGKGTPSWQRGFARRSVELSPEHSVPIASQRSGRARPRARQEQPPAEGHAPMLVLGGRRRRRQPARTPATSGATGSVRARRSDHGRRRREERDEQERTSPGASGHASGRRRRDHRGGVPTPIRRSSATGRRARARRPSRRAASR